MGHYYSILTALISGLILLIIIVVFCVVIRKVVRRIKANIIRSKILREHRAYLVKPSENEHDASLLGCRLCQKRALERSVQKSRLAHTHKLSSVDARARGLSEKHHRSLVNLLSDSGHMSPAFKCRSLVNIGIGTSQSSISELSASFKDEGTELSISIEPLPPSQSISQQSLMMEIVGERERPSEAKDMISNSLNRSELRQFSNDMSQAEQIHEFWYSLANEAIDHKQHNGQGLCSGDADNLSLDAVAVEIGHTSLGHKASSIENVDILDDRFKEGSPSLQLEKSGEDSTAGKGILNSTKSLSALDYTSIPQLSQSCPDIWHNICDLNSNPVKSMERCYSSSNTEALEKSLRNKNPLEHWPAKDTLPHIAKNGSNNSVTFEDKLKISVMLINTDGKVETAKEKLNLEFKLQEIPIPTIDSQDLESHANRKILFHSGAQKEYSSLEKLHCEEQQCLKQGSSVVSSNCGPTSPDYGDDQSKIEKFNTESIQPGEDQDRKEAIRPLKEEARSNVCQISSLQSQSIKNTRILQVDLMNENSPTSHDKL